MAEEEIDGWIDRLAGKAGAQVTPAEVAEIDRLQAAIMVHALDEADGLPQPADDALADQRAWQRIKSELNLEESTQTPRAKRIPWPVLATAASLLVALSITWWRSSDRDTDLIVIQQPPPQYHGAVPVIRVIDSDPLSGAKRLAKHLLPFAAKPIVYSRDGQATVEFELTDARLTDIAKAFTDLGIPSDSLAAGVVQVQFLP